MRKILYQKYQRKVTCAL